jgi:hypothetical protein
MQDHGEEARKPATDPERSARDKAGRDPATAPLGTDAQAAGAITPAQHIDRTAPLEDRGERRQAGAEPARRGRRVGLLIFVALVVVAVASALLMFRP